MMISEVELPSTTKQDESMHFIPTLNKTGFALSYVDDFTLSFINYASNIQGRALEIGAGYGVSTAAALDKGVEIYCNDIEPRHLDFLEKSRGNHNNLLTIVTGSFPNEIKFQENFFDAILISRVIHLFDGKTIENSMMQLYKWLKPGGKAFILADTPYLKNFKSFIHEYEKRLLIGEKWPGLISNITEYCTGPFEYLPASVNLIDKQVMKRILLEANFEIEALDFLNRDDYPEDRRLDGRESVYAIAKKPKK